MQKLFLHTASDQTKTGRREDLGMIEAIVPVGLVQIAHLRT